MRIFNNAFYIVSLFSLCSYCQLITLSLDKSTYLIGEPVYVKLATAAKIPLSLECHIYSLQIYRPDGQIEKYFPPAIAECNEAYDVANGVAIEKQGYSEDYACLIISDENRLLFNIDGRYNLRLVSNDGNSELSNPILLTMCMPITVSDLSSYFLIMENPYEYGLFMYLEAGEHLKKGFEIINSLAEINSSYSDNAKFVLSTNYSEGYYDFTAKQERPINIQKAINLSQCKNHNAQKYTRLRNAQKLDLALRTIGKSISLGDKNAIKNELISVLEDIQEPSRPCKYIKDALNKY